MLDEYDAAILVHGTQWHLVRELAQALERKLFLAGYYQAFAVLCGPCDLCKKCVAAKQKHGDKRAVWAPEIHYIKGTFWLTHCMNFGGT